MKAKTRLKLIVLFAVAMAAALIGGCSIGLPTYEETIEENNLTALVTYYGNGGYFDSSTAITYRLIGSEEGSPFYNIQSSGTSTTVTRGTGWLFDGWYYIKTVQIANEDGEQEDYFVCTEDTVAANYTITEDDVARVAVITYENQLVISHTDYDYILRYATNASAVPLLQLADAVDTTMKLAEGHIYMAANWTIDQGVEYVLVMCDGGTQVKYTLTTVDEEDEDADPVVTEYTMKSGDLLYTGYFGKNTSVNILQSSPITTANSSYTMTDGTWLEFYEDAACTVPYSSTATFTKPESGNLTVYALFTTGLWEVIKDSSDVTTMFSSTSRDYYIFNDVDCTGVTVTAMTAFSGSIKGNNHTISNLTVTVKDSISSGNYAAFGTLRSGADIQNVTFDNLTATYTTRGALSGSYLPYIYFLFSGVSGTVTISGVKVINSTMDLTVASGVTVMNIQDESDADSWLYASTRDTDETDADFEAKYDITVSDTCLKFKQNKGADSDGKTYYITVVRDVSGTVSEAYYSWSQYYTDADENVYDKISELSVTDLTTVTSTYYLYEGYYTDANGVVYDKRIEITDTGTMGSTYYTYYNAQGVLCTTTDDPSA